jgi:hypothetical protein
MTRAVDAELDIQHQVERNEKRRLEKSRAKQRLVGSYVLGAVAAWKLLTYDAGGSDWSLAMWVALGVLAFGLASVDQVLKALKR